MCCSLKFKETCLLQLSSNFLVANFQLHSDDKVLHRSSLWMTGVIMDLVRTETAKKSGKLFSLLL